MKNQYHLTWKEYPSGIRFRGTEQEVNDFLGKIGASIIEQIPVEENAKQIWLGKSRVMIPVRRWDAETAKSVYNEVIELCKQKGLDIQWGIGDIEFGIKSMCRKILINDDQFTLYIENPNWHRSPSIEISQLSMDVFWQGMSRAFSMSRP